jgi:hypothetical protein
VASTAATAEHHGHWRSRSATFGPSIGSHRPSSRRAQALLDREQDRSCPYATVVPPCRARTESTKRASPSPMGRH